MAGAWVSVLSEVWRDEVDNSVVTFPKAMTHTDAYVGVRCNYTVGAGLKITKVRCAGTINVTSMPAGATGAFDAYAGTPYVPLSLGVNTFTIPETTIDALTGAATFYFDVNNDGTSAVAATFNITQFEVWVESVWVPLRTSGYMTGATLGPGAAWSGSNVVLTNVTALSDGGGTPTVGLLFAALSSEDDAQLRITVLSCTVASPGAGTAFYPLRFAIRQSGDSYITGQENAAAPAPDTVWGAGNTTVFAPSPFTLDVTAGNGLFLEDTNGSVTTPLLNMVFLVEVNYGTAPPADSCFWHDPIGATENCVT